MRTPILIVASAIAFLGIGVFAASGGSNAPASGPTTVPGAGAGTQAPAATVCPNGNTPGSGYCRGYCGGRGANAQAGPKGPMGGRGMRTGPQDGTGPRRDGSCMYN